jgi:hypothetical protein
VKYSTNGVGTLELGDEGTFFLDHNNKIVAFEGVSGPTSYAVIVGSANGTKKDARIVADGKVIDKYPVIKLATQDNEVITYEVAVTLKDKGANIKSSAKIDKDNLLNNDLELSKDLPGKGVIVKYSLDSNDRISKISTVKQPQISYSDAEKLVFASNAVIFDATDGEDYAVVSQGRLEKKTTGDNDYAVYNSNGEIVVLLTDDVKAGTDATFAYISKINDARKDGKNVQLVVAYLNGEKVEYYTDDEDTVADIYDDEVVKVDLDGTVITKVSAPTAAELISKSTTASAVYAKVGRIVIGTDSYYLADDVTIITIEADLDVVLSDLYDVEEGVSVLEVYKNTDEEITFIVIHED